MQPRVSRIVTAGLVWLASTAGAAVPDGGAPSLDPANSCPVRLNALVMYLEETALVQGQALVVERRDDGTTVLRYREYSQHMWCVDGVLHIECTDPGPGLPED